MALPYFIWKGKRSDQMGVIVNDYPPITRPKERVNSVTVSGRNGTLTLPEGELPVYEPYLRMLDCTVKPGADLEAVCAWLTGGGQAVFGNEPNRAYDAEIINQIDFITILRGKRHRRFSAPFYCQPFKRLYPAAGALTITASGGTVTNPGTAPSAPVIQVYGSGDILLALGGVAVELAGISGGILLDWDMQDCMSLDRGTLLNYKVTGGPQFIPVGTSAVSWTGSVTKVVITPNWRYL